MTTKKRDSWVYVYAQMYKAGKNPTFFSYAIYVPFLFFRDKGVFCGISI